MLRVASGPLWKQDIDRIEFGNDMTDSQVGAQTIGEHVPLRNASSEAALKSVPTRIGPWSFMITPR